ncbi:MAG: hypothetical protein ACD_78C00115G0017 [uncultured bacterium (gcode 4)]|uniref:Uncharacterized protein n=1 Tax=uncultured bacterium (gcode 4) TaxID=1234023 RepID=K1YDB8_9BACT|nr:MAG: hypothetical protein ACD_78C00115G0017 [uncultured bacterium (gcode 4)]HBB26891.1 hypothetical protein [Candidatus Gracilibacteria bacterium]
MFKNEILVVRFGYSVLYTATTAYAMQWNLGIPFVILVFIFIFIGSLALQYGAWNTLLKIIVQKWRKWIFLVGEFVSILWFLMETLSLKENLSSSILHATPQDIGLNIALVAFAASMSISALCSKKEFEKHRAL